MASDPPGPCEDGYVAPTPVAVAVTDVPIEVASTTSDYFVLYVQIDNVAGVTKVDGTTNRLPISVTLGEDGTTPLVDGLPPLSPDRYRVEKYSVAQPGDIDGDCVDDLTELADLGTYNPVNPANAIDMVNGAVAIDSLETFQELSFNGTSQYMDLAYLQNLEFIKFYMLNTAADNPITYFINTNTTQNHGSFAHSIGMHISAGSTFTKGEIVYHPNVRALDGSMGIYRFSFDALEDGNLKNIAKYNEVLASAMPLLENNLFYYPLTDNQLRVYRRNKKSFDDSRVNVLLEKDILADVDFMPFNQAEGYGRLRLMEDDDRPSPYDVAIYTSLPNDLPRVAGTITTVPQTPLSHVNLRAIQNGLPNAFIRDALEEDAIASLMDSYVYYAVTADGYTIRAATKKEVDDYHESLRPQSAHTLQSDLTVTEIAALADVSFDDWTAFGVKAANVAELTKLSLPDGTTPVGFAVPFYFYDEFMKQATVSEKTLLGKKKWPDDEKIELAAGTTLASAVTQMLAHPKFQTDYDIQEEMLDDLRDAIKDAITPKFILDALTAMHAKYPDGQSLRYRSSTNNEDLPSFNGAGLYSSKTQDADETAEDGIDKSIKGVWASLWNYRAFLERDFHRIDHTTVYMGVLVHPNYSDELVNGVAVSYDPVTFQENAYYVNSQVGEDLVTNPEANSQPEQLLLGTTGAATVLSRSNLATSNNLLMTDAQMRQLRSNLETIHDHFETLYGVQDGDDYAIEIEFKITADKRLAIKQARPWIFTDPLELTPTVTIGLSSAQATEGAGLELTATRSGGVLSVPLTIGLTWSETGAMLTSARPGSVTIPVNQASTTINAPIDDDQEDEHDSTVTVSVADNSDYVIGTPGSATATVNDDDLTQISVRADAQTVTEGSTADFTFKRSGSVLEQQLTVDITVNESGNRLTGPLPTTVAFAANSAVSSMSLATADDSEFTATSVVTVQISASSAYGIAGAGSARVTVQDDEVPGPTLLFAADHSVSEGTAHVVPLLVSRTHGREVEYSLTGPDRGEFILYQDSGLLVFNEHDFDPPGDANQDGVYEIGLAAENSGGGSTTVRLRFTVTNAELVALAEQQWDQTGQDQRAALLPEAPSSRLQPAFASLPVDVQAMALRLARQQLLPSPGPTVSIAADGDITEGGNATFTITADPAPAADLDVTVSVSQTGDFGIAPGLQTATIPTTGSAALTVATSDDQADEANGSVTATVNRGNGYLVSWTAGAATAAIADDDAPSSTTPEVSIAAGAGVTEGGDATFTVAASPAPSAALTVDVTVAQAGDYGVPVGSHQVTVPTSGSATLALSTSNDSTDEADGSVTVTVDDGSGYTVSSTAGSASVAVADDDDQPPQSPVCTVQLPSDAVTVSEVTGWRGGYSHSAHQRRWDRVLAALGVDTGEAVMTVADAQSIKSRIDNTRWDRTVRTLQAMARCNNPPPPPPPVIEPEVSVAAGGGVSEGGDATFTVAASPAPSSPLSVDVTVAQSGDFGAATGSRQVTVPTSGSATYTVATTNDSVDEADGSVTVTVDGGSGYTVSSTAGSATVAVADDDDPPPPPPVCTVQLPSDAVTVSEVQQWRGEYSHSAHQQRWDRVLAALGVDTGEAAMTVADAQAIKSRFDNTRWDRTVRTLQAMARCNNPPPPPPPPPVVEPEVSIAAGAGVTEGGDAGFTVTADPAPSAALTVDVTVTQSGDFGVSTGSRQVTVPTSGAVTVTVTTTNDSVDEVDGSVTVTVDDGSGYTVSATQGSAAVAVVDDDDPAPPPPPPPVVEPEVGISAGSGVTEGGDAVFTVTADPAPSAALTVDVTVTASGDFGAATGSRQVTIPASGSATLTVSTTNDDVDEADGSVTVTVDDGSGYTVSATQGSAAIAVADDDDPAPPPPPPPPPVVDPGFSIEDASGTEGERVSVTVTLSHASSQRLRVYWKTEFGGSSAWNPRNPIWAVTDVDFGRAGGWLTFEPGVVERQVRVSLLEDSLVEPAEEFQVNLLFVSPFGAVPIADRRAIITINDND